MINFFFSFVTLPGPVHKDNDMYYFNNHGELLEISEKEYLTAKGLDVRLISGVGLLFCSLGYLALSISDEIDAETLIKTV